MEDQPFQQQQYRQATLHVSTLSSLNGYSQILFIRIRSTLYKTKVHFDNDKQTNKPDCNCKIAALSVVSAVRQTKSDFLLILQFASITCGVFK